MKLIDHPRWEKVLKYEWDYERNLDPILFSHGTQKKVWWVCKFDHEWEACVNSRTQGKNCPFCFGKKILIGFNDLATTHPSIVKEWNFEKNEKSPNSFTKGSNLKVWWICEFGHEWEAAIYGRVHGRGCPYCANKLALFNYNDLSTTDPELIKGWSDKNNKGPSFYTRGSRKKIWWICEKGHEWQATPNTRTTGHGCPYCNNKKLLVGLNDLLTVNPNLSKEWGPKNKKGPECFLSNSRLKVWWICEFGHEWKSTINSRCYGSGCPKCLNKGETLTGEILNEILVRLKIISQFRLKEKIYDANNKKIKSYAVIDYKILNSEITIFIEYHGKQHYEKINHFHKKEDSFQKQQQRDRWLRNYCKDNNIILIEIDGRKYKAKEEIENYLIEEFNRCNLNKFLKKSNQEKFLEAC